MEKKKGPAPGKKRVSITVNAELWEKLRAHALRIGMPWNWLSVEIEGFLPGLLSVLEHLEKNAEELQAMTEEERVAQYLALMRKHSNMKME